MSKLNELRTKYGFTGGAYEPNPNCKFCKGAGERMLKTKPPRMNFCICLFVHHSVSDFAGTSLGETARKIRERE